MGRRIKGNRVGKMGGGSARERWKGNGKEEGKKSSVSGKGKFVTKHAGY